MKCPSCREPDTKVVDSRFQPDSNTIRRRRECLTCSWRFNTNEAVELDMPMVKKRNLALEFFQEAKIRMAIVTAAKNRPLDIYRLDGILHAIKQDINSSNDKEISSETIGLIVMKHLKEVDFIAYVRFASVYKKFASLDEFIQEIQHLKDRKNP